MRKYFLTYQESPEGMYTGVMFRHRAYDLHGGIVKFNDVIIMGGVQKQFKGRLIFDFATALVGQLYRYIDIPASHHESDLIGVTT